MISENIHFKTIEDLEEKLAQKGYGDSPQLLIQIFCAQAERSFIESLQSLVQENFPSSVMIGATTDGVIDENSVYHDEFSVINFTYFQHTTLKSAFVLNEACNYDFAECGYKLMQELDQKEIQAVIAFADGLHTNGEEFLKGCSRFKKDVLIAGGMAADGGKFVETFVFDKEQMASNGAVGASLASKRLFVANYYSFDWLPIGKKMTVTKAYKNRVYEVDGERVVDIYAKYLGSDVAAKLPQIGIEFPLLFEKEGVEVGRAVLSKHDDGSLTFAGNIEEGTTVRFGVGNIEMILKNSSYHIQKILDRLEKEPQAIFVYSCMARRRFLQDSVEYELSMLDKLGNVAGFFTYGEFFHSQDQNQLLNETMTILAVSESSEKFVADIDKIEAEKKEFDISTEHAVAYLANKISDELSTLNEKLQEKVDEKTRYIYKQAYNDRLTELPNRLSLINDISKQVGSILLLVNVDDFSSINDLFGHIAGDRILLQMASILKEMLDESCKIYKLPSDEFAIIASLKHSKTAIEDFAKKIISHIEEQQFVIAGNPIYIGVTVAAAYINQSGSGLRNADMTLKLARRENRKFMFYNEDLELAKQYEENLKKVQLIKEGLKSGGVVPFFQPIVDTQTDKIAKYEALVRLRVGDEIYPPAFFLQTSEKLKFYHDIMHQMVERTFEIGKKHNIHFSINLSYSDLTDEEFQKYLFDMIKRYEVSELLTVEILETQAIDYETNVRSFVKKIHDVGAKIAIDDFGSGYANFRHITSIECDYLKIDGSLIKDLDSDRDARLIVETIIVFARKLGKQTVAEFVHSKEIFEIVKELGIDYAQGYYLGKPEMLE